MFGQGVKEMIHLLELIHGGPENIIHGAGDLYVTVFGGRTRKIGTLLGRGLTFDQAMEELQGVTLESIVIATRTARAVRKLAERGVVSLDDFPLLMHVDAIINEGAEVDIPWEKGLLGHSDADVLIHAIMDALLGAAALGDIGKHFPDTDPAYEGISSIKLLEEVGQLLEKENYVIDNIDATIIAQKPKMRPHIEKMEENIAQALKIDVSQVNVKATTEEGLGFTGSEDGISSQAICAISSIYENSIAVGGSERNCAGCPGCGK